MYFSISRITSSRGVERYRKRAYQRYYNKKGVKEILPSIRDLLHKKGPISSLDLYFDEKVDWSWAPTRAARAALDSMYSWGELIIHHRIGTRKVYDLSKKYIPDKIISLQDPSEADERYYDWNIKRRICSIGMIWPLSSSNAWLGIMGLKKNILIDAIDRLLKRILKREN
ncbi:MAG: DNA glycosylase AlkZ-like family protein [bacterium]